MRKKDVKNSSRQSSAIDKYARTNTRTNIIIAIATVIGALSTALQWSQLRKSDELNQQNIIAANRAWIAPLAAYLEGDLKRFTEVSAVVEFQNAGKEAATNIEVLYESGAHDIVGNERREPELKLPQKSLCEYSLNSISSYSVYPSQDQKYSEHIILNSQLLQNVVLNYKRKPRIFYIQGCFNYKTFGKAHHSPFCYYLHPGDGFSPGEFSLKTCQTRDKID